MDLQEAAEKYRDQVCLKFLNGLGTSIDSGQQERELLLTNGMVDDLRGDADQHQRRVRELEEHIQSDNRAEKLEESLRNTQERADEFEFQLSKLKQASYSVCSLHNVLTFIVGIWHSES
jgi:chromosome segregation ATPase